MVADPSLRAHREAILRLASKHGATNVRVFGSAARGDAHPDSDVDLLVELDPGYTLIDLGGLLMDLQDLLGRRVDLVTPAALHWFIRERVLRESGPAVKDDRLYLVHISECIARIEQYTADGRAAFLADSKTQDAVIRNLQTLTESTQRLSEQAKAAHSEPDWRGMAGFRNVLTHGYLGIDLMLVWEIVETKLPELRRVVQAMLREFDR